MRHRFATLGVVLLPFLLLGCVSTPSGPVLDLARVEIEAGVLADDFRDMAAAMGDSESDQKVAGFLNKTADTLNQIKAAVADYRAGSGDQAKLVGVLQIAADAASRIIDQAKGDKYRTARLAAVGAKILIRRIRSAVG